MGQAAADGVLGVALGPLRQSTHSFLHCAELSNALSSPVQFAMTASQYSSQRSGGGAAGSSDTHALSVISAEPAAAKASAVSRA